MSGCQHCNPYCDECKPAAFKFRICPDCGNNNMYSREEVLGKASLPCRKCGADMTSLLKPQVALCAYSEKPCAWPCGKSSRRATKGSPPCILNTPPQ